MAFASLGIITPPSPIQTFEPVGALILHPNPATPMLYIISTTGRKRHIYKIVIGKRNIDPSLARSIDRSIWDKIPLGDVIPDVATWDKVVKNITDFYNAQQAAPEPTPTPVPEPIPIPEPAPEPAHVIPPEEQIPEEPEWVWDDLRQAWVPVSGVRGWPRTIIGGTPGSAGYTYNPINKSWSGPSGDSILASDIPEWDQYISTGISEAGISEAGFPTWAWFVIGGLGLTMFLGGKKGLKGREKKSRSRRKR